MKRYFTIIADNIDGCSGYQNFTRLFLRFLFMRHIRGEYLKLMGACVGLSRQVGMPFIVDLQLVRSSV